MKRFTPGLLPTVVVLLLLPTLISLGFWQLSRGEEKREILRDYAERRAATPVSAAQMLYAPEPAWRRVRLLGRFDADHSLLLDNAIRDGKAGVELLQPFLDHASGLWLLVNRGWLPWPDRRSPPTFETPDRPLELSAWVYDVPGKVFQLRPDTPSSSWPKLVTSIEPEKLWLELGREGFPHALRLEAGPAANRVDWPIVAMMPEKHSAYAVQWFSLALALLVLYGYLGWHQGRQRQTTSIEQEST
ncbi:SURF1 family protein [Pseudomonas sp. JDS28PS106]|uniref:SURF1 family protein n=1 Tax=Pseudomonas sp. JDS28PS106 TaxID=2497235 RepID=UPI002FD35E11